ncbi:MAG: hypothetical protein KIT84_03985 [Labilithrix sp.]|nr:hypothetical protein [Labilithrix sp.]MCW5810145.1 hypothetical protein [Labilithrix sp.]
MKLTALLLGLLAVPVAVGCSAPTSEDAAAGEEALVAPAPIAAGKFDLYRQPHYAPESGCVRTTKLELKDMTAHLEEAFSGFCPLEIAVVPDAREYRLRREGTSCGSQIYAGEIVEGAEIREIKIVDHRTRLCRDVVPAKIVVTETHASELGVIEITQYSNDRVAPAETVVEGKLASVMAIGGETTGYAVMTDSGMVELVLDAGEKNQFVDGKKARVKGRKTTLTGIETGVRTALDVSSMLVCPNEGWINCMPGPGVRLSNLCAAENRSWVQANCEGVDYAD